ncbi:extradiol dioxygenase [Paenibacillus sp. FSL A5-0031]|uniref:VOC family protein n=1 Tax=unclassified Paenibacillus TaxID=185978 RepID=UPI00096FB3EC|nr:VOC family protein [Paenibacillus sp. FSL A5-0031]OME85066.1 extradiol dioxygenase [Paenibacillus sp. FSL A5-0031]
MAFQSANIFVNLPIKDLNKTVDFFTKLGFEFNPQFTDEKATCMIIGPNIFAMLLVEQYFQTFIDKEIADPSKTAEVILTLSAESKEQVDEIVNKALEAGGKPAKDPIDHGFMYNWSFQDINNHLWELVYMDPSVIEQG